MIRTRKRAAVVLAICAAGAAPACNRGPARAALAETDQALAVARPELERDAPSDLARITADTEAARRMLEAGEYTNALRIAQALPERIARAAARARARKSELAPEWATIADSLPASIEALRTRMAELNASLGPRGGGPAATEAEEAEIGQLVAAWAQAESAFDSGNVREAVRIGTDAQARVTALAARIASPRSRARPPSQQAPRVSGSPASPPPPPPQTPTAGASASPPDVSPANPPATRPVIPPETPPLPATPPATLPATPPATSPDTTVPPGSESP